MKNKFINLGTKSSYSIRKSVLSEKMIANFYSNPVVSDIETLAASHTLGAKDEAKFGITIKIESPLEYLNFIEGRRSLNKKRNGEYITLFPKNNKALVRLQEMSSTLRSIDDKGIEKDYFSIDELSKAVKGYDIICVLGGENSLLHKVTRGSMVSDEFIIEYQTLVLKEMKKIFKVDLYIGYHEHFSKAAFEDDMKKSIEKEKVKLSKNNIALSDEKIESLPSILSKKAQYEKFSKLEEKTFSNIFEINKSLKIKYVLFFESIMLEKDDTDMYQEIVRENAQSEVHIQGYNRHLISDKEIKEIVASPQYLDNKSVTDAFKNTVKIYDKLEAKIDFIFKKDKEKYYPLNYILPKGYKTSRDYILQMANKNLQDFFTKNKVAKKMQEEYLTRLETEISTLDNISKSSLGINFYDYFLIVQDYLNFYKEGNLEENWDIYFPHKTKEEVISAGYADIANKDWVGLAGPGRGSAGGFLLSFLINITAINAIEYNLLMGRFINPERIGAPDIDNDFEQNKRMFMIRYFKAKYGEEHVAKTVTYTMYKPKNSLQQGLRLNDIDPEFYKEVLSYLITTPESFTTLKDNITLDNAAYNETLADFYAKGDREFLYETIIDGKRKEFKIKNFKKAFDTAIELNGLIRGESVHASAIFITKEPISFYGETFETFQDNPLDDTVEKIKVLKIGGYDAEARGLLKMDILGLESLDTIRKITNEIKRITLKDVNFDDIDINQAEIYTNIFAKGDTTGVFQFESTSMKSTLRQMYNNNLNHNGRRLFDFASMVTAAERPGAKEFIPEMVINKDNGYKDNPLFDNYINDLLSLTFGIMIYQETSMQIYMHFGATEGQADTLRKAMAKKKPEMMNPIGEDFRAKGIVKLMSEGFSEDNAKEAVKQLWYMIDKFAGYGFNKSHSDSYTIISAKMAFLKHFYNEEFYIGSVNQTMEGITEKRGKMLSLIYDMKSHGYNIHKPDINKSGTLFEINNKNAFIGIGQIPTCKNKAQDIIDERTKNGEYITVMDFVIRMKQADIDLNKTMLEKLIISGSFDNLIGIEQVASLDTLAKVRNTWLSKTSVIMNIFKDIEPNVTYDGLKYVDIKTISGKLKKDTKVETIKPYDIISFEKEKLGVYLSYDLSQIITPEISNWEDENATYGVVMLSDIIKTPWGQKVLINIGNEEILINDNKKKFSKEMLHKAIKIQYDYYYRRYNKRLTILPEVFKVVNSKEEANKAYKEALNKKNKSTLIHIKYGEKVIPVLG